MKKLKQARAKIQKLFLLAIALIIACLCYGSTPDFKTGSKATGAAYAMFMLPGATSFKLEKEGGDDGLSEKEKALNQVRETSAKKAEEVVRKMFDEHAAIKYFGENKDKIEKAIGKEEFEKLSLKFDEEISKLKTSIEAGKKVDKSVKAQVYKFIKDNEAKIKGLYKSHDVLTLEIKAVETITTENATVPDGVPDIAGVQMAPPSNVNLRPSVIEPLMTTIPTTLAAYPYTETIPKDGDFSFIGEGDLKPQTDFKTETRFATPKKVAAWMEMSEESIQDIPGLQAIAFDLLRKKHDLKKESGLLNGSGAGNNPKGAVTYGRAFVAGAMANTIKFPNIMDVINACITDIFTTHNYQDETPYMANIAILNPIDFFVYLTGAKDEFGRQLFPTASLFNRVQIGGVTIIPHEQIEAGKILVADLSKYNITNYIPYTVKIGWINDEFIHNLFAILAESRFHAFVKKLDEQAFIYDDISDIQDDIEAS